MDRQGCLGEKRCSLFDQVEDADLARHKDTSEDIANHRGRDLTCSLGGVGVDVVGTKYGWRSVGVGGRKGEGKCTVDIRNGQDSTDHVGILVSQGKSVRRVDRAEGFELVAKGIVTGRHETRQEAGGMTRVRALRVIDTRFVAGDNPLWMAKSSTVE